MLPPLFNVAEIRNWVEKPLERVRDQAQTEISPICIIPQGAAKRRSTLNLLVGKNFKNMRSISDFERSSTMLSSIGSTRGSEVVESDLFWRVSQGKGVRQQRYDLPAPGGAAYGPCGAGGLCQCTCGNAVCRAATAQWLECDSPQRLTRCLP